MSTKPAVPSAPSKTAKKSPQATIQTVAKLMMGSGITEGADRMVIYGTGKIGKSTLASWLPAPYFLDVEGSTKKLNVAYDTELRDAPSWALLRGKLAAIAQNPPQGIRTIVIDTITVCEELAKEHVVATRKTEKGHHVESIEGFGWGKGWQFIYDEFNGLLADLDRIAALKMNVCLIAHEVASPVPNPNGEEFIRWEPLMYNGDKKGRGSIRARLKNWAEHILFVGYDLLVEDGKGQGSGTRTIFTQELPTHMAGSRTLQGDWDFTEQDPGAVWRDLGLS